MKPSNPSNKRRRVLAVVDNGTHLVTRSQAKQLVAIIDTCAEVVLDFAGVESIGQGFADELLRVWPLAHPDVQVVITGTNPTVRRMAEHVLNRTDFPQPSYPVLR